MGFWVKRYDSNYSGTSYKSIKKAYLKTQTQAQADSQGTFAWKAITNLWVKTINGWTKFWPGNPPQIDSNDLVVIMAQLLQAQNISIQNFTVTMDPLLVHSPLQLPHLQGK